MKKKAFNSKAMTAVLLAAALSVTLFTGCGNGSKKQVMPDLPSATSDTADYGGWAESDMDIAMDEAAIEESAATGSGNGSSDMQSGSTGDYAQKLIRTYNYSFQTLDFDASMNFINSRISAYGGYMETSSITGNSRRTSRMTIRIPAEKAEAFISESGSIGELMEQSMSAEDVTLTYYDVKARLESLEAQRQRLLELMNKAETLTDIAMLSSQLSDVEYDINSYQTRLRVFDNQVNYVTFYVTLEEVVQIAVVTEDTFFTRIQKGFTRNFGDVIEGFGDFIVWLISMIPYFVIWAVVILVAVFFGKKIFKRHTAKKIKRMEARAEMMRQQQNLYQNPNPGADPNKK